MVMIGSDIQSFTIVSSNVFFCLTGESELSSEFSLGHRLPGCQYWSSRSEGGETSPGAWTPVADYQDWTVCCYRAEPQRRYTMYKHTQSKSLWL